MLLMLSLLLYRMRRGSEPCDNFEMTIWRPR